ncbi:hypothetical protein ACOMHN_051810 [Nucella lapillus]
MQQQSGQQGRQWTQARGLDGPWGKGSPGVLRDHLEINVLHPESTVLHPESTVLHPCFTRAESAVHPGRVSGSPGQSQRFTQAELAVHPGRVSGSPGQS